MGNGIEMNNKCHVCQKEVEKHESALRLGILTGEFMEGTSFHKLIFAGYGDKHIRCSPSRGQHIVHPNFKPIIDDRPRYNKLFWDRFEVEKYQKMYTDAWVRLQVECGKGVEADLNELDTAL